MKGTKTREERREKDRQNFERQLRDTDLAIRKMTPVELQEAREAREKAKTLSRKKKKTASMRFE